MGIDFVPWHANVWVAETLPGFRGPNFMTMHKLDLDETLLETIISGTQAGFSMTGLSPRPVGCSRFFSARHDLAVIVGLVGTSSGSMTVNMSEKGMLYISGCLIDEVQSHITEENIDGIMELGNMVAGCIKESLLDTEYGVSQISLPSLIAGSSYSVMYSRGIQTVSVEFEIPDVPVTNLSDRFFTTTVSLLRGSGSSMKAA